MIQGMAEHDDRWRRMITVPDAVHGDWASHLLEVGRPWVDLSECLFFFQPKGAYGTTDEAFVVLTCA